MICSLKFLIFTFLFCLSKSVLAVCSISTSGKVEIRVGQCLTMNPARGSKSYKSLPRWVMDLDPSSKAKLLSQHKGLLIRGQVTESQAVTKGLVVKRNALKSENISVFIPLSAGFSCRRLGQFVRGSLKESCCDGGGTAPCLWQTGYLLDKVKTSEITKMTRQSSAVSNAKKMKKLYKQKRFKKLLYNYGHRSYEFKNNVEFQYYVGMAYFKQENCKKAKNNFTNIHEAFGSLKANLAHNAYIKEAIYNLAVCHARDGDAQAAVMILEGMKLKSKFFSRELKRAYSDKAFGRIKSSPAWKKFSSK